jgi:predicted aspartyl protease
MSSYIVVAAMLAQVVLASRNIEEPPINFSLLQNSLVVIPVFINGRGPYKFVLDTGATTSILSVEVAGRLNIRTVRNQRLITAGGLAVATIGSVDVVQIGAVRLLQTQIAVVEADFLDKLQVDGILGSDYLKQFKISIDYTRRILSITR